MTLYQTRFELTDKDMSCSEALGRDYTCRLGAVSGKINIPKVTCIPLTQRCSMAVNVVDRAMASSEFSRTYQPSKSSSNAAKGQSCT